jgi:hypothetical protein
MCPEAFSWHPIEYCIELLEKAKYSRFSQSSSNLNSTASSTKTTSTVSASANKTEFDINNVKIRVKFKESDTRIVAFTEFCEFLNPNFIPQFKRLIDGYCCLFGPEFSKRVLIKF